MINKTTLFLSLFLLATTAFSSGCFKLSSGANRCPRDCGKQQTCCAGQGGISYCDSSAGRYVCRHGGYSSCYCTRHAVMDLQKLSGCCLWKGGVHKVSVQGLVICNDGDISELCSIQRMNKTSGTW